MKKHLVLLILMLAFAAPAVLAQTKGNEDQHEHHEKIVAARIAHITSKLNLSPEQAQKFWPVYNEFSAKRDALRKQHKEVMHAVRDRQPSAAEAQRAIDNHLRTEKEEARLAEEYYGNKLKAVLEPVQMLRLMQAEYEFKKMLLQRLKEKRAN